MFMKKIKKVASLEQAKKLDPSPGMFVVIQGYSPKFTEQWNESEGSSLPKSLEKYKKGSTPVVIVKITDRKVKVYAFPEGKAFCTVNGCTVNGYHQALKQLWSTQSKSELSQVLIRTETQKD